MTTPESCATIISQIKEHIPGNPDLIPAYFADLLHDYSHHPCFKEILAGITLLSVQSCSHTEFQALLSQVSHPEKIVQTVLDLVHSSLENKNIKMAESELSYILPYAESSDGNDGDIEYVSFRDFIEYAYYVAYQNPDLELPVHPYLGTDILFHQGKLCAIKGERDDAYKIFHRLSHISPANAAILCELAELYRGDGNLAAFRDTILLCFKYAWKPDELAQAYRNMGYYFTEMKDYTGAVTCYLMGSTWEDSQAAARELAYIKDQSGKDTDVSYILSHGREILTERDVPFGPNQEMIELMVRYADECKEEGDFFEARKYLSRAKALELSDALEREIEVIERFIEDNTIF